jgi:hypothetical protein
MTAFTFKLERPDGTSADPPMFRAAVPDRKPGHEIYFPDRTLRMVATRLDEGTDGEPVAVLVVELA